MRLGDVLEWVGAIFLFLAALLGVGLPLALAVAGVALGYFAQCYGTTPLPKRAPKSVEE